MLSGLLLRKLYRKGSLREVGAGRIAFSLHNVLGDATVTSPPTVVVNGVGYGPGDIECRKVELASISPDRPYGFRKGERLTLRMQGHLMRGGNRIHIAVETREWGGLEIDVEDIEAPYCEVPGQVRSEEE